MFKSILPNIIDVIVKNGGKVYLVGGCVRDKLLGKEPQDYDIVTNLRPDKLVEIFSPYYKVDLVGKSFGVVIVEGIEIATFRKDVYSAEQIHTKGADSVEFADTIKEDLSRRDFTFNSIAVELRDGESTYNLDPCIVIDPYGGYEDIQNKIVRFTGNANERIKEDPCRILRAFRFASVLGFEIENIDTICFMRPYFLLIAPERIRLEILKTLSESDDLVQFFMNLKGCDVLKHLFPCLDECYGIEGGQYHDESVFLHNILAANSVSKKYPLMRLAALLHDVGKAQTISKDEQGNVHFYSHEVISEMLVRRCLEYFKFSTREIDYVCELVLEHMFFFEEITKDSTYRRFMSNLKVPVRDVLRMRIADRRGNLAKKDRSSITKMFKHVLKRIRKIEKEDKCLKIKDLAINGNDLIEMGYKQGPIIGKILRECLELVLVDPSVNNREFLLKYIEKSFVMNEDFQKIEWKVTCDSFVVNEDFQKIEWKVTCN